MSDLIYTILTDIPSSHDVLTIAGHRDDDPLSSLGSWFVGDLSVDLAVFQLVTVEVSVDHEVVDALQVHVGVSDRESLGGVHFPFAYNEILSNAPLYLS